MVTSLVVPDPDRYDDWRSCVEEFGDGPMDGSSSWQVPRFGPDRHSFTRLLAVIVTQADPRTELADGQVHADHFWVVDEDGALVGFVAVRHSIDTEFLRNQGGHIGYSVRPSRRRQGHASRALGLAVERERELGVDRVLVSCDEANRASARTIEGRGGVFEDVRYGKRRYWIEV